MKGCKKKRKQENGVAGQRVIQINKKVMKMPLDVLASVSCCALRPLQRNKSSQTSHCHRLLPLTRLHVCGACVCVCVCVREREGIGGMSFGCFKPVSYKFILFVMFESTKLMRLYVDIAISFKR